jgi:hypothetical protein
VPVFSKLGELLQLETEQWYQNDPRPSLFLLQQRHQQEKIALRCQSLLVAYLVERTLLTSVLGLDLFSRRALVLGRQTT